MKDAALKELFDFYPQEEKYQFYVAYLYLKHMDIFTYDTMRLLQLPTQEPKDMPHDSLRELLHNYVIQIAQNAPSRDTNIYHGKIMNHDDARKLITLDKPVRINTPERVVPYRVARDIILEDPGAIAVGRCACRINQPDPCVPPEEQEVCLIMGEPFASFIAAHNPLFRKCSRDEAMGVIEKAHRRGDVHAAYFKKELGNRLMALCNCCRCCCLGMVMWNRLKGAVPFLAPSGYTARVGDDCSGCRVCVDACPFYALAIDPDTGKARVDESLCMGCGVCQDMCLSGSISLMINTEKGDPLDMDVLLTRCT